jgi:glycosyltransferase involved in cell wall biosynthesis
MPKITALIHTHNDGLRLGRALDSLRSCDQVIVVDHGSTDNTEKVARDHGAEFKEGIPGVDHGAYSVDAEHDWVFCLRPNESVSESLEAALFEWKSKEHENSGAFNVGLREESEGGWRNLAPESRLVNRKSINWTGDLPPTATVHEVLGGELLRFQHP